MYKFYNSTTFPEIFYLEYTDVDAADYLITYDNKSISQIIFCKEDDVVYDISVLVWNGNFKEVCFRDNMYYYHISWAGS